MAHWTYRFRPQIDGRPLDVRVVSGFASSRLIVTDGTQSAQDCLLLQREVYRLNRVQLGDLVVEAGARNWISVGVRISRDGQVLHESHPHPFALLPRLQQLTANNKPGRAGSTDIGIDWGRLRKTVPATATDIAFGLLFFVVAKLSDLRMAALVTAAAGLLLCVFQWLMNRLFDRQGRARLDLLGGPVMFGVVMMLVSAAFSWAFDSERAVQLKSTWLGLLMAGFFAIDAWRGGAYLGRQLAMYGFDDDIDPQRLAAGFAAAGATMALVNAVLVLFVSKDAWLYYHLWGDAVVAGALMMWVLKKARRPRKDLAASSKADG